MAINDSSVHHNINVLILAAGPSESNSDDGNFPLCLAEIKGVPLIQRLVQACTKIDASRFIAAFTKADISDFHLDDVMRLLVPTAIVVGAGSVTGGAACTALLATGYIDRVDELLIVNANEFIDVDYELVISDFRTRQLDAGTVTFPSIHPRYSYVRVSDEDLVVEASEKRPISRHATAGFYWFARGKDFVRAAQAMISKDAAINGKFYICPTLNELVLEQARIGRFPIEVDQYCPLKTPRQILQEDLDFGRRPTE